MIGLHLKDIVDGNNVKISSNAPLHEAIELMSRNGKGVIVAVDGDEPSGILTERDVVNLMYHNVNLNEETYRYTKKQLITVKWSRTAIYALTLMRENNIRRLIVTDDKGKFAGVITQQELLKRLEDDFYRTTVKVKHIIEKIKPIISCSASSNLKDVLSKMVVNSISSIPVIENGKAIGIITEKDIVRLSKKKIPSREKAEVFMSSPVITVSYETPLTEVAKIMSGNNIRRVIINNSAGKAEGIITDRDLLRNIEGDYNAFIERKLRHTKDILNLLPEMLIEIIDDGEGQLVIWANEKVVNRLGKEIVDRPVTDFIPAEKWNAVYKTLLKVGKVEDIKFKKNDEIFEFSGFSIETEGKSENSRIQLIIRDITEDVKLYTTDPLTGLYNRRFLNEFITKEVEISRRMEKRFSLAIIDIDDFKKVNDMHGHAAGDAVLKAVSKLMVKTMRKADVVGRYGGEEFIIIMPETSKKSAVLVLERLRCKIASEKVKLDNSRNISVTVSFGVSNYPADGESSVDMLITADDRLYKAKREGKNRIVCE